MAVQIDGDVLIACDGDEVAFAQIARGKVAIEDQSALRKGRKGRHEVRIAFAGSGVVELRGGRGVRVELIGEVRDHDVAAEIGEFEDEAGEIVESGRSPVCCVVVSNFNIVPAAIVFQLIGDAVVVFDFAAVHSFGRLELDEGFPTGARLAFFNSASPGSRAPVLIAVIEADGFDALGIGAEAEFGAAVVAIRIGSGAFLAGGREIDRGPIRILDVPRDRGAFFAFHPVGALVDVFELPGVDVGDLVAARNLGGLRLR